MVVPSGKSFSKSSSHGARSFSKLASILLRKSGTVTQGTKVRVNGKNRPVLRVNEWQTGVLLPAGKNRVEFEYRPTLFRVLMALTRITVVLLVLCVILAVVRNAWASSSQRQSPDQLCS